ncbi:hypothetical protein T492DRAFT_1140770 [Pavlovales sp. CCMP2436]|nr:hypothetical protein T492DRAFT_1140770 [Pavlovales sp. CCMP2436]
MSKLHRRRRRRLHKGPRAGGRASRGRRTPRQTTRPTPSLSPLTSTGTARSPLTSTGTARRLARSRRRASSALIRGKAREKKSPRPSARSTTRSTRTRSVMPGPTRELHRRRGRDGGGARATGARQVAAALAGLRRAASRAGMGAEDDGCTQPLAQLPAAHLAEPVSQASMHNAHC